MRRASASSCTPTSPASFRSAPPTRSDARRRRRADDSRQRRRCRCPNDLTLVRGRHQLGLRRQRRVLDLRHRELRTGGRRLQFQRHGDRPGAGGLHDRAAVAAAPCGSRAAAAAPGGTSGCMGQDAWRVADRVTLNAGLRWEPFFGQQIENGSISIFSLDNFRNGTRTTALSRTRRPDLLYPGDAGFPDGNSGMKKQWLNLSPRVGVAWDVTGDGRTAVRSSYGVSPTTSSARSICTSPVPRRRSAIASSCAAG